MLEFALVLPAFTALTMGCGELSQVLMIRQSLASVLHQTGRLCSVGALTQDELTQMIEQKIQDSVGEPPEAQPFLRDLDDIAIDIEDVVRGDEFKLMVTVPFTNASWTQPVFCSGIDITVQVLLRHE